MKIYVSGKITGLDLSEARQRFDDAEALLSYIGFEVVNPTKNGIPAESSWKQHLVRDIELLMDCDAIYMMDGWTESVGAGIEYDIANRTGKDVWFASNILQDVNNHKDVLRIQNAIHEVTGLKFGDYTTKSRKREGVYARMIFVHNCRQCKMTLTKIAKYVHRNHSTLLHLLKKYNDDFDFNPHFRDMATKVTNLLNRTNKETKEQ